MHPNHRPITILRHGCLLVLSARLCCAETTNLSASADAYVRNALPNQNFGGATTLLVGVAATGEIINHGLFRFSLANLPTNATITGANLRLTATSGTRPAVSHSLYRLLRDWRESEVTWNNRLAPATAWGAPGGQAGNDYVAAASATAPIADASANNFTSSNMIADLQLWLANPEMNFGWILIAVGEQAGSGKQLSSREVGTAASPVLQVQYTVPSSPIELLPIQLFDTAHVGNSIRFSFDAQSNRTYAVEFRDTLSLTNWSLLTNIPALPADATVHLTNNISGSEGYFRVATP